MHFRTRVKQELRGISGQDEYSDGMVEHDMHIGKLLDLPDELGVADNAIVFYSPDDGVHMNTWPDGGTTPFQSEKNTNREGAMRVPAFARWPGYIEAGSVTNGIVHHMDWMPTLLAIAGVRARASSASLWTQSFCASFRPTSEALPAAYSDRTGRRFSRAAS